MCWLPVNRYRRWIIKTDADRTVHNIFIIIYIYYLHLDICTCNLYIHKHFIVISPFFLYLSKVFFCSIEIVHYVSCILGIRWFIANELVEEFTFDILIYHVWLIMSTAMDRRKQMTLRVMSWPSGSRPDPKARRISPWTTIFQHLLNIFCIYTVLYLY